MATKTQETKKSGARVYKELKFTMMGFNGENNRTRLLCTPTMKEATEEAKYHCEESKGNTAIIIPGTCFVRVPEE